MFLDMGNLHITILFAIAFMSFSGCADEPEPNDTWEETAEVPVTSSESVVLAARNGDAQEFDALCIFGGASELKRNDNKIDTGTEGLVFRMDVPVAYTGYRVGYTVDGGEINWLPTLSGGEQGQAVVDVLPSQTETGEVRWRFYMEANVKDVEQDCYTGIGSGSMAIEISTIMPN